MKGLSLKSLLVATVTTVTLLVTSTVSAQGLKSGNILMGLNPFAFDSSNEISAIAPSYMVGYRINDTFLPYAYFSASVYETKSTRTIDSGYGTTYTSTSTSTDTKVGLGGGLRVYLGNPSNIVRIFAGGAMGIVSADDMGFNLGGFFGAEAMITDNFSISGQVGAEVVDSGAKGSKTTFDLGVGNVMFNLYFF